MPRKRKTRKHPAAPDRPSRPKAAPRGAPFPKGNTLGLPTRYQPGKSGNPGGVPKDVREFRELMRVRTAVALARLDDVLDHGTEEGIIKASREVLANGWGRPMVAVEVGGAGGGPMRVTYDDVRARVTEAAAKAVAAAAEEPEAEDQDAGDGDGTGDPGVPSDSD